MHTKLESQTIFYQTNKDIFLRHFDSENQYDALIRAGQFDKMKQTIISKTNFSFEQFLEKLKKGEFSA